LIWLELAAVAVRLLGAVGGCVSADVVALATFEYELRFPAASVARTR
jgi:Fe-S cluster biogenesis protein NfuA